MLFRSCIGSVVQRLSAHYALSQHTLVQRKELWERFSLLYPYLDLPMGYIKDPISKTSLMGMIIISKKSLVGPTMFSRLSR